MGANFSVWRELPVSKHTSRSYGLDFLKVLATIAIVFHHYQQVFDVTFENHINFFGDWFYWGYMVELFFLLSGYFMYRYTERIRSGEITLSDWFYKRAIRLLPLTAVSAVVYEALFVVYYLLYDIHFSGIGKISAWGVVVTALGIQEGGVFVNPNINNPVWYISVLMICYVAFYLVTRLSAVMKCKPHYLYIAMMLLGVGIIETGLDIPFLNRLTGRGYRCFFYGLLLAQFVQSSGITRKEAVSCSLILAFFTAIMVVKPSIMTYDLENVLCFLMFPSTVLLLEFEPVKKRFSSLWGKLGQISFNVYIWHVTVFLVLDLVCKLMNYQPNYHSVAAMYLVTGLTVLAGILSGCFLEKPLGEFVGRQFSSLPGRAARMGEEAVAASSEEDTKKELVNIQVDK